MAETGGLQILPQARRKLQVAIPGQNRNLIIGLVLLFVVVASYFLLLNYRNRIFKDVEALNSQIKEIEDKRDKIKEKKLLVLGNQLTNVSSLLNSHILWSVGLKKIEGLLTSQVVMESIEANMEGNSFNFRGTADGMITIARQIASFYSSSFIKAVAVKNIDTGSGGRAEFNTELKLDTDEMLQGNIK